MTRVPFLQVARRLPEQRPTLERVRDFDEIPVPMPDPYWVEQADRCQGCGVPFCHQGCPLGNLIPDWLAAARRGQWREAYDLLAATNDFPELTGRLCPAPCEAACTVAVSFDAVAIEVVEGEIIERAFAEGWVQAGPTLRATGKRVAVVGSGPAGLAAASQLRRKGHDVDVFEAADRPGGLLRYGIPDFKLEKSVLDRRLDLMRAEGIVFHCDRQVGVSIPWSELRGSYDAVLVAIGARAARDLEVPGRELAGVHFAMPYLTRQNRLLAGDPDTDPSLDARGKDVIILGGGDTGSDCLGTALRQGAASVHQVELLPRPPDQRAEDNPWPQWPNVLRTSSSQREGGTRRFGLMTREILGAGGAVTGLRVVTVRKEGGRLEPVSGSEEVLPANMVLLAMGYLGPEASGLDVTLPRRTDDEFATEDDTIYYAGDARRGQSLIVWAIHEGRRAAAAIHERLGQ